MRIEDIIFITCQEALILFHSSVSVDGSFSSLEAIGTTGNSTNAITRNPRDTWRLAELPLTWASQGGIITWTRKGQGIKSSWRT